MTIFTTHWSVRVQRPTFLALPTSPSPRVHSSLLCAGFSVWIGQPSSGRNELTLRQHKCLNLVTEMYIVIVRCQANAYRPIARAHTNTKRGSARPAKPKMQKKEVREKKKRRRKKRSAAVIRTHRREIKKKIGNHFIFRVFGALVRLLALVFRTPLLFTNGCRCRDGRVRAHWILFYSLFGTWTIEIPSRSLLLSSVCVHFSHLREPLFSSSSIVIRSGRKARNSSISIFVSIIAQCVDFVNKFYFKLIFCDYFALVRAFVRFQFRGVCVHEFHWLRRWRRPLQRNRNFNTYWKKKRHLSNLNLLIFGSMMPPLDR